MSDDDFFEFDEYFIEKHSLFTSEIHEVDELKEEDAIFNMHIFSVLTQRTLSAFHKAGVDSDLYSLLNNLKIILQEKPLLPRVLVNAVVLSGKTGKVKRYFSDGYIDEVYMEHLSRPSYAPVPAITDEEESQILVLKNTLSKESHLEGTISYTKYNVKKTFTKWLRITKPSDKAIFRYYLE